MKSGPSEARFHVKQFDTRPAEQRLHRCTRLEADMFTDWLSTVCDALDELVNALCDHDQSLIVDTDGIIRACRILSIEAPHIAALAVVVRKEGAHVTDYPPF